MRTWPARVRLVASAGGESRSRSDEDVLPGDSPRWTHPPKRKRRATTDDLEGQPRIAIRFAATRDIGVSGVGVGEGVFIAAEEKVRDAARWA